MAEAAIRLGIERAMFVTGEDGLDELTITGNSYVVEVKDGTVNEYILTPEDVGLERGSIAPIVVDSPEESAEMIKKIFQGNGPSEGENIVLLNAGAAMYVYGVVSSIAEGVHEARKGLGETVLNQLSRISYDEKNHFHRFNELKGQNEQHHERGEKAL